MAAAWRGGHRVSSFVPRSKGGHGRTGHAHRAHARGAAPCRTRPRPRLAQPDGGRPRRRSRRHGARTGLVRGPAWRSARRGPRAPRGGQPCTRGHRLLLARAVRSPCLDPAVYRRLDRRARGACRGRRRRSEPARGRPWPCAPARRRHRRDRRGAGRGGTPAERRLRATRHHGAAVRRVEDRRVARRQDGGCTTAPRSGSPRRKRAPTRNGCGPGPTRSSWAPGRCWPTIPA